MTTVNADIDVDVPVSTAYNRLNADETRISVQLDWEPEGARETVGAALQVDDMQISRDLRKFKEIIESNGFETGAWRGVVDRDSDATGR